jgi:hypothetical protein
VESMRALVVASTTRGALAGTGDVLGVLPPAQPWRTTMASSATARVDRLMYILVVTVGSF